VLDATIGEQFLQKFLQKSKEGKEERSKHTLECHQYPNVRSMLIPRKSEFIQRCFSNSNSGSIEEIASEKDRSEVARISLVTGKLLAAINMHQRRPKSELFLKQFRIVERTDL